MVEDRTHAPVVVNQSWNIGPVCSALPGPEDDSKRDVIIVQRFLLGKGRTDHVEMCNGGKSSQGKYLLLPFARLTPQILQFNFP